MGINELRNDVKRLGNVNVYYVQERDKSKHGLSVDSPACIEDNDIFVLDSLPNKEKIEAEAHELAHLLIRYSGIIAIKTEGFLELEVNNAISHIWVISRLDLEYEIGSSLHLICRCKALQSIKADILYSQDKIEILHGLGVSLFDIKRTIPEKSKEVGRASDLHPQVCEAYKCAEKYLSSITPEQEEVAQIEAINNFMVSLGYKPYVKQKSGVHLIKLDLT